MKIDGKITPFITIKYSFRLLRSVLGPQIIPKSVTLSYHGSCLNDISLPLFDSVVVGKDAAKPIIRNPIDRINVTAGELLRFKVPEVSF